MFGTLRPHACGLPSQQKDAHQRFYCGLCKTLGDEYSQASRVTLNFDAVFVAILADAVSTAPAESDRCRCPMLPIVQRSTVSPRSPALRYAAAVQMLLADQWVADRAVEGQVLARVARPLLKRPVERAHTILEQLQVDLSALCGFEEKQAATEQHRELSVFDAAQPTAWALGVVFSSIADLPQSLPDLKDPLHRGQLDRLGRAVGRVIYFVDALEDLHEDFLKQAFNPCLRRDPWDGAIRIDPHRIQDAIVHTQQALEEIALILPCVPWQQHQALLENILCQRFERSFQQAKARAQGLIEEEARQRLEAWQKRHWLDRFSTRLFVAVAAWFVWFQHLLWAATQGPPGGKAKATGLQMSPLGEPPKGGGEGASCSCCEDLFRPCFRECGKITEACGQSCSCVASCNQTCGNCTKTCTEPFQQCGQSCQKGCSSCGKDCGKACEPCGGCKNCCPKEQGGNPPCCDQCCKDCKGCENCGKSGSDTTPLGC
ncbi:DUF5685 family protein [Myxococcota bacterium]|nr:DUF5685 family protein [Myxococcota bacterium]